MACRADLRGVLLTSLAVDFAIQLVSWKPSNPKRLALA
jgi:hypothetical protein